MINKKSNIGCVIVTFNRLEKLRKTLSSYATQKVLPLYIIVVNNASTDGTDEYLEEWKHIDEGFKKVVVTSPTNIGGSGGFYLGEQEALKMDASWIMIADDDAYPQNDYLEGMQQYIDTHDNQKIAVICGKVKQRNSYINFHRGIWKSKWAVDFYTAVPPESYQKDEFYPDFVSYVGILLNKEKLKQAGLVNKDNFIWHDDIEHIFRLSKTGKVICIPKYEIVHDVDDTHNGLSWKSYYGYRNSLNFFKRHFPTHYPFIIFTLACKTLLIPLKGKSLKEMKVRFSAIKDSLLGYVGKHNLYKPGWKP